MGVIVVEVIEDDLRTSDIVGGTNVTETIRTAQSPADVVGSIAVVEVVRTGGTISNVGWGFGLPSNPVEGQIWIDVS